MKRVLIIDDDKDFSRMMKRNLESTGRYEALLTGNGKEGLTLASRHRPDLILLDMAMPRMDGLEILKKLKKKRETQNIPVIIISGKEPDSYISEVIGSYAEHIFSKPVGLSDLNSRIEELFHFIPLQGRPRENRKKARWLGAPQEGARKVKNVGSPGRPRKGSKRILIIEDDDHVRGMLKQALEIGGGVEVREAPDGEAGLTILRDWPADLVVTDMVMPNRDGMEVICELRTGALPVKIIAISGGARVGPEEYLEGAKFLGAHRTLSKPFSIDEFLKTVRDLLDGSSC